MTGLGPVMPDVEEVDSARPLLPLTSLVAAVAPDEDDDSDFLPTVDRTHQNILADELNDDEDNSAMCKQSLIDLSQIEGGLKLRCTAKYEILYKFKLASVF